MHESFVVEAFRNVGNVGSLDYLRAGLPAFLAERMSRIGPLRFAGPARLLGGTLEHATTAAAFASAAPSTPSISWVIAGEFSRSGEKVSVLVAVKRLGPKPGSAQVVHVGTRAEMPQLTLAATIEAMTKVMGGSGPVLGHESMLPFSRDPYAFVLYGRGIASYIGLRAHDSGSQAARKWLVRALRVDPKCPEIMHYLGMLELAAGNAERARTYWLGALAIRPNYVGALADLARVERDGKLPSARDRFGRLVALDPDDTEARRVYGQLLADAGEYGQAKAELDRLLEKAPDDLAARRALSLVLASEGTSDAIITNLEQIVRLDDGDQPARLDLAAAYAKVGRLADAEATYDEVLRRKPRQPTVLKLVGDLATARGDYEKARSYFARMHALAPADPRPVFRLGAIYFALGDLKAAERWYSEALHFPGMVGAAYGNLGAVSLRKGQTKEALWLLGRAAKHRPTHAGIHFNLAHALFDDNRPAAAMTELQTAQELAPRDAGVRFLRGIVALRLELLPEAEEAFRETLRLDPHYADAAHNLSLLQSMHRTKHETSLEFSSAGYRAEPAAP